MKVLEIIIHRVSSILAHNKNEFRTIDLCPFILVNSIELISTKHIKLLIHMEEVHLKRNLLWF
ncbi:hypothetical protein [Clostridium sp. Marseille-Q2269]|uniref:hypothetical protein n=1 Tax=Clostridium sp. Marseille-Q2269 TaxID=2942205 RepID=UPI002072FCE3|nr:hypothetical protein [Clostridium sp. Marseille-Q2269]